LHLSKCVSDVVHDALVDALNPAVGGRARLTHRLVLDPVLSRAPDIFDGASGLHYDAAQIELRDLLVDRG
jgi:hypothetical protein